MAGCNRNLAGGGRRRGQCCAHPVTAAAVLLSILGPWLPGCERQVAPRAGVARAKPQVALIALDPDDARWPGVRGGAQRYVRDIPMIELVVHAPADRTDAALRRCISAALRGEPQAACLLVPEERALRVELAGPLEELRRRQIATVTIGAELPGLIAHGEVAADLPAGAELLARRLHELVPDRQSYAFVHEDGADRLASDSYIRFYGTAIERRTTDWHELLAVKAQPGMQGAAAVEHVLGQFPHVGILVTLSPQVWLDAAPDWPAKLQQRSPALRIATLSAAPRLWHLLGTPEQPVIAAGLVGVLDGELGYRAVRIAADAIMSEKRTVRREIVPMELVTADTLEDFARRYAAAADNLDVSMYYAAPPREEP